ncbi:hypothetical protein J2S78_000766 [Salibacterium salarium]|uniref:hypothetical protein n=1 Tax=Salibacterium salarium TaxID=284579 RepID=UPI0027846E8F|nr:hypothetical protein [Salibacterium salarium]MDQ0298358.1 hypothetical protein [Salibacterium salarium]
MKLPMVWVFLMLSVFVIMFFVAAVSFQGMKSSLFQIIGFSGMIFSLLYGLLTTENAGDGERNKQEN